MPDSTCPSGGLIAEGSREVLGTSLRTLPKPTSASALWPLALSALCAALRLSPAAHGSPDPSPLILPGAVWRDDQGAVINAHGGGILRNGGRYYWYGQHMVGGSAGNAAQVGVHVYSSEDLCRWRDDGIAMAVSPDPQSEIAKGCIIERPKVIFNRRSGKFVMWFHLEGKGRGYSSAAVGVAVADGPAGPFRFRGSFRPNAGHWPRNSPVAMRIPLDRSEEARLSSCKMNGGPSADFPIDLVWRRDFAGGQMSRDMSLFVDDDGAAYLITASEENATLQISRLADDFLGVTGDYVRVLPNGFNEAPAVFKRRGRYFMFTSGTTGWAPNACRLATAPSIWGPWLQAGNPCSGTDAQTATTFESQSTYVLEVSGRPDLFIFMADRWRPQNPIDGRYVWLPIRWRDDLPVVEWRNSWSPLETAAQLPAAQTIPLVPQAAAP